MTWNGDSRTVYTGGQYSTPSEQYPFQQGQSPFPLPPRKK